MKSLYTRTLMTLMFAASYTQMHAFSILFVNTTQINVYVKAEAKYQPDDRNSSQTSHFHHKLKPGQKYPFNYAKTRNTISVLSLSFQLSDDNDSLAIPAYECDTKHHKSLNNKLLESTESLWSYKENNTVYIAYNKQGELIASLSDPKSIQE